MDTIETVKKKMCKMVRVDYSTFNFDDKEWFLKHSWDTKTQDKFRAWLFKYMRSHKQAQQQMMSIPTDDKFIVNKFVSEFVFCFGWRNKK